MWIPVALARDVPAGVTRAIIVDGAERLIWRADDGRVQVWEDRCPHRGMRLSLGFVRGNALNCLYHGWEYAAASNCLRIPAHPDLVVPNTIRARAFPVAERYGIIWTRAAEDGPPPLPLLSAASPVATIAVAANGEVVLKLCDAVPRGEAQIFTAELDGMTFNIGWHAVGANKTMLHACVVGEADMAAALQALRGLRARAEARQAA